MKQRRSRLNLSNETGYHFINRKGAGRSGPCNPGGVSPSLFNDCSCITGSIFTGPATPTLSHAQLEFVELWCDRVGAPASSGSIQFSDETKADRLAPLPVPASPSGPVFLNDTIRLRGPVSPRDKVPFGVSARLTGRVRFTERARHCAGARA